MPLATVHRVHYMMGCQRRANASATQTSENQEMTKLSALAAALLLSTAAVANAAPPPEDLFGPPMGQIVNWAYFPHPTQNFPTYSKDWTG